MQNKYKIGLLIFVAIFAIIPFIFIKTKFLKNNNQTNDNLSSDTINLKEVDLNYSSDILVSIYKNNESKTYNINFEHANKMQKIKTDFTLNTVFYENNSLIYKDVENNSLFVYKTENNYSKILSLLSSLKLDNKNIIDSFENKKTYKVELSKNFIKNLYENLFIKTNINYKPNARITTSDGKINSFKFVSLDTDANNSIEIDIDYNYLDKEYKINDSEINEHNNYRTNENNENSNNGSFAPSVKRQEEIKKETDKNILELTL